MAFSEANKVRIFDRLGHSWRGLSVDTDLLNAINVIGGYPEVQALVESLLDECDRVEVRLKTAQNRQSIKSLGVNDIQFTGFPEIVALRSEMKRYVGRIANALGLRENHSGGNCIKYG